MVKLGELGSTAFASPLTRQVISDQPMPKPSPVASRTPAFVRVWRQIIYRPRLLAALGVGVVAFFALYLFGAFKASTAFLAAWNLAAWLYLILAWSLMFRADTEALIRQAERHDEGEVAILLLSILAGVFSLLSIIVELSASHGLTGLTKAWHIGLAFVTILSSWAFIHTAFSMHYAHGYYLKGSAKDPPLGFPGREAPLYPDFLYFAFVIGTSAQTADVSFTHSSLRRVGLVHCIVAFAFNTTVVALMINLAASLIAN
jgi:uncharacterized membrane protein